MSFAGTYPSYMPVERAAAAAATPAAEGEFSQEKLGLVIPTFQEAGNIGVVLDGIRAALDPAGIRYEVLVVDDDSRDGTAEAVAAIAALDPQVRLLVREGRRGLSGAIQHGWRHTDATILGVMDADLQHPPSLLPEMLRAMGAGSDLVIGSRYAPGSRVGRWNPVRRLASEAAVWLTRPLQPKGMQVQDPLSGYFLVRRDCLEEMRFVERGFKLLLEILVRAPIGQTAEIPFEFGRRRSGASKATVRVAVEYAGLLARLYAGRLGLS